MKNVAVLLHNVRSAHNVGSIFRTADGAGVKKLYLCGITPSPLDRFKKVLPGFAKVALGAERFVAWEHIPLAVEAVDRLRKEGFFILVLEQAPGAVALKKGALRLRKRKKIAVVIGAEIEGVSQEIVNTADMVMKIPMRGKKESLNVSVAFGIIAYALVDP